jgi:outer membrane protein OmpA-like peptidoglycan-associated protein/tetratricopeptide (TPR) repeat protein
MKQLSILSVALFLVFTTNAQNVEFTKQNFEDKKVLKEALNFLEMGDYYMSQEWPNYILARQSYQRAYELNPNNAELNYKMGLCVLHDFDKTASLEYFTKAHKLDPNVKPDIRFYLGIGHQLNYSFDDAIYNFREYRNKLVPSEDTQRYDETSKRIAECETAKKLVENPIRVWIDNLGSDINSKYAEYSAFVSADESKIIFTTRRSGSLGGKQDPEDNRYFEDIYVSEKKNGKWEPAYNAGENINTESHDATAGMSHDGTEMLIYYGFKGMGDIYIAKYKDGVWGKPKSAGKYVNGKSSHESAACFSPDGTYLYFVSDREGGFGGRDIWRSPYDVRKEEWGEPENLGPTINTRYDEAGIYMQADGKTIYFASKGHETMGGYDLFVSTLENGKWTTPKNLGHPVNTPDDDVFFVVSASGKHGYYASFRPDGEGEKDLYMITFLGPEKQPFLSSEDNLLASIVNPITEKKVEPKVQVQTASLTLLKGIVRDEKSQQPLPAVLELVNNTTGEVILNQVLDNSGKYMVTLPSGGNYGIAVKADKYLFHSENFDIPTEAGYRMYEKNVDLKKVEIGKAIVLRNIFYDLDKATLRPESKAELERLNKLMIENPTLKIELSGHTDSRGSDAYNQKLSENRAKAVVDYLVNLGISKDRMVYIGYGEQKPIKTDEEINKIKLESEREAAHQENRRTEFKILSL